MSALATLQSAFLHHVLVGDPAIAAHIVSTTDADANTRLEVYASGYRLRLIEVLEADYPCVRSLLGVPAFAVLARGYIAKFPSPHYSLRSYGQHLASHLTGLPIHTTRAELAEMADFEWRWGECFDAADSTPISVDALAEVPPQNWLNLAFDFVPGTRHVTTQFNIADIRQAVQQDSTPPELERHTEPSQLLLWRRALQVLWRVLERDEAAALTAAHGGADFPALCDVLITVGVDEDDVPLRAATLIKRWLHEGLICGLRTASTDDAVESRQENK